MGNKHAEHLRKHFNHTLKTACQALKSQDSEAIHTVRVQIKQARAALNLFRYQLDKHWRKQAARELKSVAKQLSSDRDAQVMREQLTDLLTAKPQICQRLLAAVPPGTGVPAAECIVESDTRLKTLKIAKSDFSGRQPALSQALNKQYQKVSRLWRRYHASPDDWHLCRREVKSLQYQLHWYDPQWADNADWQKLRKLGQLLGDWHDLELLDDYCAQHRANFWLDDLLLLKQVIGERRAYLERRILRCGDYLFSSAKRRLSPEVTEA